MKITSTLAVMAAMVVWGLGQDTGSVTITVKYDGNPPEVKPIPTNGKDEDLCGKEIANESLVVDASSKGIKNAVVDIPVTKGKKFEAPKDPIVIDNAKCAFVPHVRVIGKRSRVAFENTDSKVHNVKANAQKNESWNENIAPGKKVEKEYKMEDVVKLACDVHPWMTGYLIVVKNPNYAGVSDDKGEVKLADVPSGKYTVKIWHETLGEKTVDVTVEAGKEAKVEVLLKK